MNFGRQRAPFYLYSDYLDVSYAYHWIAPPTVVYDAIFDSFDGFSSIYTHEFDDSTLSFQAVYGSNNDNDVPIGDAQLDINTEDYAGAILSWNNDWLTLRTGYFVADVTIDMSGAPEGSDIETLYNIQQGWAFTPHPEMTSELAIDGDAVVFLEAGLQVDYNDWVAVAEMNQIALEHMIYPNQKSWYLSLGKRIGKFTPHITYGVNNDTARDMLASIPNYPAALEQLTAALPDPTIHPDYAGLTAITPLYAGTQQVMDSLAAKDPFYTIGLRWEIHDSVALKFEYTNSEDNAKGQDQDVFKIALTTVF